jgi:anti-sigma regulatory factor (Ser/Thr protein kinase)
MAIAVTETTSLIAFALPSIPYSVQIARFYIRAALIYHDLCDYAEDAGTVTSELVTNAINHAGTPAFGLQVMHLAGSGAVAVIVTDSSPDPPVKHDPAEDTDHGRGLNIVEALTASWGWMPEDLGKSVYAILAPKEATPMETPMETISDLPMLHDIDADYSPRYVKLARVIRGKIESGEYQRGDPVPAAALVNEHKVSMRVAWAALAMLAANRYVARAGSFKPYKVTWDAARGEEQG